ncbi:unnamed protein product, partial [Leptidea sinapis]|jgi:hypothetical protein
LKTY